MHLFKSCADEKIKLRNLQFSVILASSSSYATSSASFVFYNSCVNCDELPPKKLEPHPPPPVSLGATYSFDYSVSILNTSLQLVICNDSMFSSLHCSVISSSLTLSVIYLPVSTSSLRHLRSAFILAQFSWHFCSVQADIFLFNLTMDFDTHSLCN